MKNIIAYAVEFKKGDIHRFPMDIYIRLFKEKKDAIFHKEEHEKIIKVEIREIK